jgi:hypothetical protein
LEFKYNLYMLFVDDHLLYIAADELLDLGNVPVGYMVFEAGKHCRRSSSVMVVFSFAAPTLNRHISNHLKKDKNLIRTEGPFQFNLKFPYGFGAVLLVFVRRILFEITSTR